MPTLVEPFFDPVTGTVTYVVYANNNAACAIIDPVLDYDAQTARTSTYKADTVIRFIHAQGLCVEWILETHIHADHLSAAAYLKNELGGRIAIGAQVRSVQKTFKDLYPLEPNFKTDGSQFDHLFAANETFAIGALPAWASHVPGHTPADTAYGIGDAVFVGDTLFMPDVGTARCDFPGGDAATLYRSIKTLLSLPADTRLFVCHDYPPAQRTAAWQTTVRAQRKSNIHIRDGVTEAQFVAMRQARDQTLPPPKLMQPAVHANIRAGAVDACRGGS
jgi:glyoxylase-like metal-dependent hydrolase (beta-lactamase superfamily II)